MPRDVGALVTGLLAVSISAIVIRLCASAPSLIAFYRLIGAGLIFVLFTAIRSQSVRPIFRDFRIALAAGFFLAAHFYLWISSLFMTSIYAAVVLFAIQPLFALILQAVFQRIPIARKNVASILIGIAGAAVIAGVDLVQSGGLAGRGDLFALVASAMVACYLFVGSYRRGPLIPYLGLVYTIAATIMFLLTLWAGIEFAPVRRIDWLWFAILALVPTLIGHSLLNRSMKHFPAYVVNLSLLCEPVLVSIWAWLIFREALTMNVVAGGVLIVIAVGIEAIPPLSPQE